MPTRSTTQQKTAKSKRGFAAMPPEKTKEIAKKGGEHSHGGGRRSSTKEGK